MEVASWADFVFRQLELKRLHHPLLNNVMLLHFALFSHDFWHAVRLPVPTRDPAMGWGSTASISHWILEPTFTHSLFEPVELVNVCFQETITY